MTKDMSALADLKGIKERLRLEIEDKQRLYNHLKKLEGFYESS